jgi:hypothetical protein
MRLRQTLSPGRSFPTFWAGAFLVVSLGAARLPASDLLSAVPGDVAGVIVLRDLESTTTRLNAFLGKIQEDCPEYQPECIEESFCLEAGTWDASLPVAMVLTRDSEVGAHLVLAFTPKNYQKLLDKVDGCEGKVVQLAEGEEESACILLRDGVAFVGERRKAVLRCQSVPLERSLAGVLDDDQKALLAGSDVFMRVPVGIWRERLLPMLDLAVRFMKLRAVADSETGGIPHFGKVFDFFGSGARRVLEDAKVLTLSATLDGKAFRLTGHVDFSPGTGTARFLSQVRSSGRDPLKALPDMPFTLLMVSDWQNTTAQALTARLCQRMLASPEDAPDVPEEVRDRLMEKINQCYGQTLATYVVMDRPPREEGAMRVQGGYLMKDAAEGIKQFQFIHETGGSSVGGLLAPVCPGGKYQVRSRDGIPYIEMQVGPGVGGRPGLDARVGVSLFGEGACIQKAVADKHTLVFSIGQAKPGVTEFIKRREARSSIADRAGVRAVLEQLPPRPHALAILDLNRVLQAPGRRAGTQAPTTGGRSARRAETEPSAPSLLGTALVIGKDSATGHLAIREADVVQAIRKVRRFAPRAAAAPAAPAPPAPVGRPIEP